MYDPVTVSLITAAVAATGTGFNIARGQRSRKLARVEREAQESRFAETERERLQAERESEESVLLAGRREREKGLRRRGRRSTVVSPLAEGFGL